MMYQHRDWLGNSINLPVGKVVCVGSNYVKHIHEMGSALPPEPILFIKPATSLCPLQQPIKLPIGYGSVHHEIELAVLIGASLRSASKQNVQQAIAGYAIALDLTLRDLQQKCKQAGHPWEKAKAFDNACPISGFISRQIIPEPQNIQLTLSVNGMVRQQGNTNEMLTDIFSLIAYMSYFFTLKEGDIVLTGTPSGVGALVSGDNLTMSMDDYTITTTVV